MSQNNFKYLDDQGNHIVKGSLTGWLYSDAVRQNKCSKCGSEPGFHCETPKNKKAWPPHSQRL